MDEESTKSSILFVDDEAGFLNAVRRTLRYKRDEWDMAFALSADEALVKTSETLFDVIITDVKMPGKDGLMLLKVLQESETTRHIPVIVLTGLGDADLRRRALDLGATDLLSKPVQDEDLVARIRSALRLKAYQDKLMSQNEILERNVRELKKLQKLRTDLFNMLIHDLKGPISVLVGNLDILVYTLNDKNLEYVQAAQTGCDTLNGMISNLLDIARLEDGSLRLVYENIDPQDVITESVSRLSGIARSKEVELIERVQPPAQDKALLGDRSLLLRVMQNLLDNAIGYSPHGETIEVAFEYADSDKIIFSVSDNGPGVLPEFQDSIFDKFEQAGMKKERGVYTAGLGLAFCKMAVEAHNGTICVESDGIKGSCFKFVLPLEQNKL